MTLWSEENLVINGLAPVADALAGTKNSDIIDISEAHRLTFLVWWGVGATGTVTLTVQACSTITATATTDVAFKSKRVADYTASDVPGDLTAQTSAGFTTTAGSHQLYIIEVDPAVIAATGYRYARLHSVESVDSELLGGILAILSDLRVQEATPASMID